MWDASKKNLLVGKWCYDEKIDDKNYDLVDYHWKDEDKIEKDIKKILNIYEAVTPKLIQILNQINDRNYSKEFWELLIYRWTSLLLVNLYDRWEVIEKTNKEMNIQVNYFDYDKSHFIPLDTNYFTNSIQLTNEWSHYIFYKILLHKKKKFKNISFNKIITNKNSNFLKNSLSKGYKKNFFYRLKAFFHKKDKIFIQKLYFSLLDKILLSLKFFQTPTKFPDEKINDKNEINFDKRSKITEKFLKGEDFENFFLSTALEKLPKIFFENFSELEKAYENLNWPKSPKYIFTSLSHFNDEIFKFYTAKKKIDGAKLFIHQHGGTYGLQKHLLNEYFEKKISDRFLTWGWEDDNKCLPLHYPYTNKNFKKKKDNSGIIISAVNFYNIPGRIDSFPRDIYKTEQYNKNLEKIISGLYKDINKISVKYFDYNRSPNLKDIISSKYENICFITSKKKKIRQLSSNYRLTIETLLSTGFVESMYYNIPVVLLTDKNSFRAEASDIIYELKKNKIIFFSADKLVDHVKNNYNNITNWWENKNLQFSREEFCKIYAKKKRF